jgi:hypothetical protein
MKNALVSDLVFADLGPGGDHVLRQPLTDEHEWTEHLARQLAMDEHQVSAPDVHATLLFIVEQTDALLRDWPLPTTPESCRPLADAAAKHLDAEETYRMLLAGPGRWRTGKIGADCTVDSLPAQLRRLLEKALETALSELFTEWVDTDIRQLADRWRDLAAAEKEDEERRKAEVLVRSRAAKKRPTREEMAANRIGGPFTPPREYPRG